MVDKNVAFNRDGRSEEFAENDPLAELARIVGYEDRPRHVSPQAAPAAGAQQRRDPSFNLEDELLREFAVYDAPRDEARVAANDEHLAAAEAIHANDFLQRVEDVFARREPEFAPAYASEPAPVYQDDLHVTEAPIGEDLRYTMNAQPQNYADEIYTEPQTYASQPVEAPLYAEPQYHTPQYDEPVYEAPLYQEAAQQAPAYQEPTYVEPVYQDASYQQPDDLSYEVERSLVEDVAYPAEPVYSAAPVAEPEFAPVPSTPITNRAQQGQVARSSLEFSSMRQPLGNFAMSRATPFIPKSAPVSQTPVQVPFAPQQPSIMPAATKPQQVDDQRSDLDALIADVSRYSIGTNERQPNYPAAPVVARQEPVTPVQAEPAFDLSDDAFEAALDNMDFEFDLSDIELADNGKRDSATNAPMAAPQPAALSREQPVFAPRSAAAVAPAANSFTAPVARQEFVQPAAPKAPENLPFDLDQIGDTEDQPETLSDFDVPELPPLAIEPKVAPQRHDDDLELDTELAALFTPNNTGLDRQRGGEKPAVAQPVERKADVDEFERALEADFRRSLQENPTKPNKIQANPSEGFDNYSVDEAAYGEQRSFKRWMMPAVAIVGALVVVGGVYATFFSSSAVTGTDGLPVVIAADDEPMKVVPAEPGGRVVPNQDKAVYDRVAGNASSDPKQPALISSDEQPVDVVQHTLIPEQVAIDDEGDFPAGGEALDTVDPRLLPDDGQDEVAANIPAEAPVNVAPRRVRTMIVKPDGTLVAQEVDAPSPAPTAAPVAVAPPAPQVATPVVPAAPVAPVPAPQPVETPVAAAPAPVAPAPAPAPIAAAPEAPAPTTTASSGGFYIQIASLPSDAEAQKTYKSMSAKFGSVIGGRGVDIKRAEIAGRGTYYRVRIPAGDRAEANALCQRFQSAGGSCLVTR